MVCTPRRGQVLFEEVWRLQWWGGAGCTVQERGHVSEVIKRNGHPYHCWSTEQSNMTHSTYNTWYSVLTASQDCFHGTTRSRWTLPR